MPSYSLLATTIDSDLAGRLVVVGGPAGGLRALHFCPPGAGADDEARASLAVALGVPVLEGRSPLLVRAVAELRGYLAGRRRHFSVPLDPNGTPFEARVWAALLEIPYGEIVTYGELARRIGQPNATRAVAGACGRNPLPIVIPCHRVVASDGLGGFGGGLPLKRRLLALEGATTPPLLRLLGPPRADAPEDDGAAWLEGALDADLGGEALVDGLLDRLPPAAWPDAAARALSHRVPGADDVALTVLEAFAHEALAAPVSGPVGIPPAALARFVTVAGRAAPASLDLLARRGAERLARRDHGADAEVRAACEALMADETATDQARDAACRLWIAIDPEAAEAAIARFALATLTPC